jgi:serine/threonine-protein kinase HipA
MRNTRPKTLDVLIADKHAGTLTELPSGKYRFEYAAAWQANPRAVPLSYSMPIAQKRHPTTLVQNFMWGMLPDNQAVLEEWARRYRVSPSNPFALLTNIGEDCPGAVQLVPEGSELAGRENVKWLKPGELEARIVRLRQEPWAARLDGDPGQFSLAGAQAKTALYRVNKRWGIPRGRTPTTHILKPETGRVPGIAANEHFCLLLARAAQMPAAISDVLVVQDIPVIIVERFDRRRVSSGVVRIHEEDMCQALGLNPRKKYQSDGGPGAPEIMALLENSNNPLVDRDRFMRALALNFIIAGTDAHARNYSIIYAPGGAFRLAPLYDVISDLPYARNVRKSSLAMTIGGEKVVSQILPRHWEALASSVRYSKDAAVGHVRALATRLPDLANQVRRECAEQGLKAGIVDTLTDEIGKRCAALVRTYGAEISA